MIKRIFAAVAALAFLVLSTASVATAQSAYPSPQLGPETGLYRLYNPVTMNHLYTVDYNEAFDLNNSGLYRLEGTVGNIFINQVAGSVPVWRLYNRRSNKHAFVAGTSGLVALRRAGYRQEAVIAYILNNPQAYSPTANQGPRLYWMQNSKTRDWLLTQDAGEAEQAKASGYVESSNWYWLP